MVARTFDCKGWTPAQYDELIEKLGGQAAPGVVFHWAAQTDGGMLAVDVYASRDAADELADGLASLTGELGLSMPEITEYEVHGTLVGDPG